jgi:hypothetical protein
VATVDVNVSQFEAIEDGAIVLGEAGLRRVRGKDTVWTAAPVRPTFFGVSSKLVVSEDASGGGLLVRALETGKPVWQKRRHLRRRFRLLGSLAT